MTAFFFFLAGSFELGLGPSLGMALGFGFAPLALASLGLGVALPWLMRQPSTDGGVHDVVASCAPGSAVLVGLVSDGDDGSSVLPTLQAALATRAARLGVGTAAGAAAAEEKPGGGALGLRVVIAGRWSPPVLAWYAHNVAALGLGTVVSLQPVTHDELWALPFSCGAFSHVVMLRLDQSAELCGGDDGAGSDSSADDGAKAAALRHFLPQIPRLLRPGGQLALVGTEGFMALLLGEAVLGSMERLVATDGKGAPLGADAAETFERNSSCNHTLCVVAAPRALLGPRPTTCCGSRLGPLPPHWHAGAAVTARQRLAAVRHGIPPPRWAPTGAAG